MPVKITVRGEGITTDLLLFRQYGVRGQALVEKTLEANPHLSKLPPVIPLGTIVTLPDLPVEDTTPTVTVVSLFD